MTSISRILWWRPQQQAVLLIQLESLWEGLFFFSFKIQMTIHVISSSQPISLDTCLWIAMYKQHIEPAALI